MLLRVLEPEVMDSEAEASDYDAMDHAIVNRAFASDFFAVYDGSGPVLDVGTGTAQIPIELCRQHPTLQMTALDASPAMLRLAQHNIERANLSGRIRLQSADAKRLPFPDAAFSAVVSNSIVHHIPVPLSVLAEMVRVTSPGGTIFVRDLLRPVDDARVLALVELHAAGANANQRARFDASLRAALPLDEMRSLVAELGFDRATVRQTTARHRTWIARKA